MRRSTLVATLAVLCAGPLVGCGGPFDHAVVDVRISPDNPEIGQKAQVRVTIRCLAVKDYVSAPTTLRLVSPVKMECAVGYMIRGETLTYSFELPQALENRDYQVTAVVAEADLNDTNWPNNYGRLKFRPKKPCDLSVEKITLSPESPRIGQRVQARVLVKCRQGETSHAVVKLYDGNTHPAYRDSLAVQKTSLLGSFDGGAMREGDAWNFNFTFTCRDRMYDLHAVAEGSSNDPTPANNTGSKRFRPRGGKDVVLQVCHVLYRNLSDFGGQPGVYLSDDQVEKAKEQVRKLAQYVWDETLCLRLSVETIVSNRMLIESDFHKDANWFWGYNLKSEFAENDLYWNHGIDMTGARAGKRTHSMYIVQHPLDPPSDRPESAPLRMYGLGWWQDAWQGGYLYQWSYLPGGNIRGGNMVNGLLVHEMLHGLEFNLKRRRAWNDSRPLHPEFPLTHRDWEDGRYKRITGVDYEKWTFGTTPTSRWMDLNCRTRQVNHDSDQY